MYANHQNYFLPEGLNSSSSTSSLESATTMELFGSSSGSEQSAFRRHLDHVINGKEGKMFVGGLSWYTSTESMRHYFSAFGQVDECVIMRDAKTKITRGFGFVTFTNPSDIGKVLTVKEHFLDGKKIDPQVAIRHISPARSVNNISRKVFIGGVSQQCSVEDVKEYFSRYGEVEDAILKMDYPKHQHRGFGFMTFVASETADLVCAIRYHVIKDKTVECKMAQKKEFVKPNAEAAQAASTFLNNLPPEQVLAIYGVLLKGIVGTGQQQPQPNTQSAQPQILSNPNQQQQPQINLPSIPMGGSLQKMNNPQNIGALLSANNPPQSMLQQGASSAAINHNSHLYPQFVQPEQHDNPFQINEHLILDNLNMTNFQRHIAMKYLKLFPPATN